MTGHEPGRLKAFQEAPARREGPAFLDWRVSVHLCRTAMGCMTTSTNQETRSKEHRHEQGQRNCRSQPASAILSLRQVCSSVIRVIGEAGRRCGLSVRLRLMGRRPRLSTSSLQQHNSAKPRRNSSTYSLRLSMLHVCHEAGTCSDRTYADKSPKASRIVSRQLQDLQVPVLARRHQGRSNRTLSKSANQLSLVEQLCADEGGGGTYRFGQ